MISAYPTDVTIFCLYHAHILGTTSLDTGVVNYLHHCFAKLTNYFCVTWEQYHSLVLRSTVDSSSRLSCPDTRLLTVNAFLQHE